MTKQLERLTHETETILDVCARTHPISTLDRITPDSDQCLCTISSSIRGWWTPGPDWPNPHFKWLAPEMYKEQ